MQRVIVPFLCAAFGSAMAQAPAGTLPPDVQTLTGEALQQRLVGKTYNYLVPTTGAVFRLEYNARGYAFINGANGFNDSAAYRVEGSKVCTDWKKIPANCVEMRAKGEVLYAERSDGTWGTMTLR